MMNNTKESMAFGTIQFKDIQIKKDDLNILGSGSYGQVYRATCDKLQCAAKIIYTVLLTEVQGLVQPHRQLRHPIARFQKECEIMSSLQHPNIVQFMGTTTEPVTGQLVLLMELMDENLTSYLSRSKIPVPYHIQVTFIHDICLALSYLHSNNIIHRDLSSNNILLISDCRAKVTDFGMAKLRELSPPGTVTTVPGTEVYMGPETILQNRSHTDKIDCFSLGVLIIQVLTGKFPEALNRFRIPTVDDPSYRDGTVVLVPEVERRKHHISLIDDEHPFKFLALSCIKDKPGDRPSAEDLSDYFANERSSMNFTESRKKAESIQHDLESAHAQIKKLSELNVVLRKENVDLKKRIRDGKKERIKSSSGSNQCVGKLVDVDGIPEQKPSSVASAGNAFDQIDSEILPRQRSISSNQLEDSLIDFDDEGDLPTETDPLCCDKEKTIERSSYGIMISSRNRLDCQWLPVLDSPKDIGKRSDAVVIGTQMYCTSSNHEDILSYDFITRSWSIIPGKCPTTHSALASVHDKLVLVGGKRTADNLITNKIYRGTEVNDFYHWMEDLPPMPTKRYNAAASSTDTYLIVVGGRRIGILGGEDCLKTVEVLDINTLSWTVATGLPNPLVSPSISVAVIQDSVYAVGGIAKGAQKQTCVYGCKLQSILAKPSSSSTKKLIVKRSLSMEASAPDGPWRLKLQFSAHNAACTSVDNHLVFIGGTTPHGQRISEVHSYNVVSESWLALGCLNIARSSCVTAALPQKNLLVAGGEGSMCNKAEMTDLSLLYNF